MDKLPLELICEIADFAGVLPFIRTMSLISKAYNGVVNRYNIDFFHRLCTCRLRSLPVSPIMSLFTCRTYPPLTTRVEKLGICFSGSW